MRGKTVRAGMRSQGETIVLGTISLPPGIEITIADGMPSTVDKVSQPESAGFDR